MVRRPYVYMSSATLLVVPPTLIEHWLKQIQVGVHKDREGLFLLLMHDFDLIFSHHYTALC